MGEITRTYTNSDGMTIELSKEHLDKAVEVKLELQQSSPSLRCNWKKHKEVMSELGIKDSDTNESYRCAIKAYQKQVGLLSPLHKHVDMVADNKLDAINRVLGDIYSEKRENQLALNQINKLRRDLHMNKMLADEFKDLLIDELSIDVPHYVFKPRMHASNNKAILVITDWHIGAEIKDVKGNSFNLEIAKKRINKLKQEALDYCSMFSINDLHVCCLGDAIEHSYMRSTNQAADSEIHLSKQIVMATRYIFDLLVSLSEYVNVEYEGISGNHDRANGDRHANIDGDNMMVVVNENIKDLIKLTGSARLTMIDNDCYMNEIVKELNGKRIKLVHGDEETKDLNSIKSHISMDNQFYDAIVKGHLHSFRISEENDGRMVIQIGCLSGRNNYSKKLKCTTNASQGIIVVREDGEIIPIKIDLQIN